MIRRRRPLLALAALAACALLAPPAAQAQSSGLTTKALYENGPSGRYLMGGEWLFRPDPGYNGERQGFQRQATKAGWSPVGVPHAWNAGDDSEASFMGGVGWYRKDFRLPSAQRRLHWVVRFESVNYRARIYLNGRLVGQNRGAYLPFEIRLPSGVLKRGATNRLVVRVDSRRLTDRLPARGPVGDRVAARRLVELRRPAARGLPAQGRRRRPHDGRGAPRPPVRHLRRHAHVPRDAAQPDDERRGASPCGRASAGARSRSAARSSVRGASRPSRGG